MLRSPVENPLPPCATYSFILLQHRNLNLFLSLTSPWNRYDVCLSLSLTEMHKQYICLLYIPVIAAVPAPFIPEIAF